MMIVGYYRIGTYSLPARSFIVLSRRISGILIRLENASRGLEYLLQFLDDEMHLTHVAL